jgi:hypothetical protein
MHGFDPEEQMNEYVPEEYVTSIGETSNLYRWAADGGYQLIAA